MMLLFPALPVNAASSRKSTVIIDEKRICRGSQNVIEEFDLAEDSKKEEIPENVKDLGIGSMIYKIPLVISLGIAILILVYLLFQLALIYFK